MVMEVVVVPERMIGWETIVSLTSSSHKLHRLMARVGLLPACLQRLFALLVGQGATAAQCLEKDAS